MNAIAIPDAHDPILTIDVKDLFDPENTALSEALDQLRASVTSEVYDVTEEKGRKQIARLAHKVARTKTAIDGAGKEYVSGLKNQAKKIDAIRKHAREYLDDVKAEVRAPLTEWEEQEKARQEEIERMIQEMHSLGNFWDHTGLAQLDSKQLQASISTLDALVVDIRYGERMTEAKLVKADLLGKLRAQVAAMAALEEQQRQEEQARIEAERLAREEREREIAERARQRERAEAQRREAEQKKIAERQLIAAQQREEMAKQQAERERIAAQEQAAEATRLAAVAKQNLERERIAAQDREARMKAAAEKVARIAKQEQARQERENKARLEAEEAKIQQMQVQYEKRIKEMEERGEKCRIEAIQALDSIVMGSDNTSVLKTGELILNEIIEGNIPHVRFTD